MIRQPIVAVLGHVDHGKTSLLDNIRGSAVASREAGGITQAIGASIIPIDTLRNMCGSMLASLKINITIPGLLFIDTPGHAAFSSLRKRGGSIADIAVLVIDINEGIMPQTMESISILKSSKTPFVIAANKVDMVKNWSSKSGASLIKSLGSQNLDAVQDLDKKLYTIVGDLYNLGFTSERFDRVDDYTKQVAIVPLSAKTGEGVSELLLVLVGLAQKYLESSLNTSFDSVGRATILEVKQLEGVGTVVDAILYDGSLSVKDSVIVGSVNGPLISRIKSLLQSSHSVDIRDRKTKFSSVKSVVAATGVRIKLLDDSGVIAGMPLIVANDNVADRKKWVSEQITTENIPTFESGVVIKADTIGSLEALNFLLLENNIPVSSARIGPISKRDIADAEAQKSRNEEFGCIISFNLPIFSERTSANIIQKNIIYSIIDDYKSWVDGLRRSRQSVSSRVLPKPAVIKILKGFVFRQSNPAVVGVEVVDGVLETNTFLMNGSGKKISQVKGIQEDKEKLNSLSQGNRAAVSLSDVVIGRTVREGETLFTVISEDEFKSFKDNKDLLSDSEKKALKTIAVIMRENNPVWGV
ncbi:translation initiation factor IF-2 [Candidatus Woesearchaeota archaeon]|nr:translation initiation factor IF-2 [Candidatus Woesearchaeota archaeon]